MRRSLLVSQLVGAASCVLSVVWILLLCIKPGVSGLLRAEDSIDAMLQVAMPLALGLPGVLLFVCSWKLMRHDATRDRIKNVLGILAGFGSLFAAFLLYWVYGLLFEATESGLGLFVCLFLAVACVLPTYAWCARRLMRASGIVSVKGEFVGRGSFQILAFLLWAILSSVTQDLFDRHETDTLLDFGFMFVPFIIPYILYRLAVKYWVRDTFDEQVALDFQSKHRCVEDV